MTVRKAAGKADKSVAAAGARGRRCPLCGRPAHRAYRPFCSRRCADLDLGHWLRGDYRVPTDEPAPDAGHGGEEDE